MLKNLENHKILLKCKATLLWHKFRCKLKAYWKIWIIVHKLGNCKCSRIAEMLWYFGITKKHCPVIQFFNLADCWPVGLLPSGHIARLLVDHCGSVFSCISTVWTNFHVGVHILLKWVALSNLSLPFVHCFLLFSIKSLNIVFSDWFKQCVTTSTEWYVTVLTYKNCCIRLSRYVRKLSW